MGNQRYAEAVPGREVPRRPDRRIFWGWLLLTLVLLLMPGPWIAQGQSWLAAWLPLPGEAAPGLGLSDKLVHGMLFAVLGLLAARLWPIAPWFGRVMLALLLLGVATELAQHFIPGRAASPADFGADALGLLLGAAGWRLAGQPRRQAG